MPPLSFVRATSLAAFVLLAASNAAAQSTEVTARSLFEEGLELADQDRFEEAADRFRRSYALVPRPATELNLSMALVEIGQFVEASERIRRLLRDRWASQRRRAATLRRLLERAEASFAWLRVEAPASSDGILLDGSPLPAASLGVDIPLDPRRHVITTGSGREIEVALEVGEHRSIVVAAEPPTAEAAAASVTPSLVDDPEAAAPPPSDLAAEPWLWVLLGVGAAALVAGAIGIGFAVSSPGPEQLAGNTSPGRVSW